jgi:hypothetical protein
MTDIDAKVEAKAHELYWDSDESVNQIAEDLGLSKGSLYSIIRPLPAGLGCPECGEELLYPNRTARERGMVGCPSCGFEGEEEETDPYRDGGNGSASSLDGDGSAAGTGLLDVTQKRTLIGGALLGAAAGLALVFWSRRR